MTDGPDWAETLNAVKKVPGKGRTKNDRLGMDQVAQWQEFQQQRTGADVAVAVGAVDTGDDFDGWGHFTEWAADQIAGFVNIWNGWFGSGGTGAPAQTQYVIESIKDAVINGYTVHTVTSNETNWAVPSHTEMIAILIGGGMPGSTGGSSAGGSLVAPAAGGLDGSYIAQPIDLTGITALDMQVGTAGNKSYIRVANATPHTGAVVLSSPAAGSPGGIASQLGYTTTSSTPGRGGQGEGGGSGHQPATAGTSTPSATGGAIGGNNGVYGLPGGAGGTVSAGATTKCGGAGGGGGGAGVFIFNTGGTGGAGGYPGGGGGGGGCGINVAGASGGPGAPGVIWLFYR